MPFDDDLKPKKGQIGIKNANKSRFISVPKKPSPSQFSEQVRERESKLNEKASDMLESTKQIVSLFRDKTLKQNKDVFFLSLENESIQNFIDFCAERNDDVDAKFNGEGSLTAISLLIKLCLEQKDKINELEYKLSNLVGKINEGNNSK